MDEHKEIPVVERTMPPEEAALDLKALREAKGLTLHDIFETTRVSPINLSAVENGDYPNLPPPVYARNFIRKYARAVGIDEERILDRYEKYQESLKPHREETTIQKPWPEANRRYRFLYVSLAAVIAAGILVSAFFLYDQGAKQPSPGAGSAPPPQAAAADPAPAAANIPAPQDVASTPTSAAPPASIPDSSAARPTAEMALPAPSMAGKMYHLVIEARDLTWIRITEDRNPSHQVLLKPGDKIERMASETFQLDIGNAGGINLTFQGKSLGVLGKPGQIIHMRLPEKEGEKKP